VVGYHRFRGPCCLHHQGELNGDGEKEAKNTHTGVQEGSRVH